MYDWHGLNQIEDDSWLLCWIDRCQQKGIDASHTINNTSFVDICVSSIVPAIIFYLVYIRVTGLQY